MPRRPAEKTADDLLTSPQAAAVAGLHRVHFARLVREGKGPKYQKVGPRIVLIRRGDLEAWMADRNQ
jgi:excisionase family DNA binding protein